MYTCPDVFFINVGLAVFSDGLVPPAELRSIVGEKVVVPDFEECFHSFDDGGVFLVSESYCPSFAGVIIFHGEKRNTVEHRQISLDEMVGTSPFEMSPFDLCAFLRFNDTSSDEDS